MGDVILVVLNKSRLNEPVLGQVVMNIKIRSHSPKIGKVEETFFVVVLGFWGGGAARQKNDLLYIH